MDLSSLTPRAAGSDGVRRWLPLAAILLLALVLGLRGTDYSLWYDEIASTRFAAQPWSRLWSDWMISETNPPLYYSLLKLWIALVGDSDAQIRLLSTVIGLGGIACAWQAGCALGGQRAGLLAALLVATSQQHIFYGQMARGYELGHSATLLALVGLTGLARGWTGQGGEAGRARAGGLAAYAIGAAVAVYSHTTLVLVPVLANLWAIMRLGSDWRDGRGRFGAVVGWVAANLVVLAAWSWWGRITWLQSTGMGNNIGWIVRPSAAYAVRMTLETYCPWGFGPGGGMVAGVLASLLFIGLFLCGLWRRRADWRGRGFDAVALFALGAPVLLFAISLYRPVFLPRTVYFGAGPFLVGVACGLASLTGRRFCLVLALALGFNGVAYTAWFRHREIEPWRAVAAHLAAPGAPDAVVTMGVGPAFALERYCPRPGCGMRVLVMPSPQVDRWAEGMARPTPAGPADLADALACGRALAVLRWGTQDPAAALPAGTALVGALQSWGPAGSIGLSRVVRSPAPGSGCRAR